ncbi:hypothetical protein D3C73_1053560 [compost metagenome]
MGRNVVHDVLAHRGLPHKYRRAPQTQADGVMSQNAGLQGLQAVVAQRVFDMTAVLGNDMGKPLDTISLVGFLFDQKACTRLLERQPTGRTHQDVGAKGLIQLGQCFAQIKLQSVLHGRCSTNQGTELSRSRQIVIDSPTPNS